MGHQQTKFSEFWATIAASVVTAGVVGLLLRRRRSSAHQLEKKIIVITGAGSGLGRTCSRILSKDYHAKLLLVDRNQEAIVSLKKELGANSAIPFCCDLSNPHDVGKLCNWVQRNHGDVSGLLHFAGLTHGKRFLEATVPEIDLVLSVNFLAVIKLTRLLLPTLLRNQRPIVLVVSSVAGLTGANGLVDYCASKHGVTGFCESLRKELRDDHPEVCICCVHPYLTNTGMFAGAKGSRIPELDQEYVSARIVQAICNREEDVVVPGYIRFIIILTKVLPRRVTDFVDRLIGTDDIMQGYTGRLEEPP